MRRRFVLCLRIVLVALALVVGFYLVKGVQHLREDANRMTCAGKLKQLGLALLNFQDHYGCLPPAYVADERGRPMHSWRVLVLEFIGTEHLYKRYDFGEHWDGPNNAQLADGFNLRDRTWLQCPSEDQARSAWTSYVAVVGPGTLWPGDTPGRVTDVSAGKILLVEVANSGIHWMEPRDLELRQALCAVDSSVSLGLSSRHPRGIQYVTAADQVGFLPAPPGAEALRGLLVVGAGEAAATPPEENPSQIVQQLLNCSVSRVPYLRRRAAQMLGRLRREPGQFVPHFAEALKDQRPEIRSAAVEALKQIDPEAAKKAGLR